MNKVPPRPARALARAILVLSVSLCLGGLASAQPPEHQPVPNKEGAAQAPVAAETAADAQHGPEADEHAAEGEHGSSLTALLWPTVNFAILVGLIWYFFKAPFVAYLQDRHTTIRRDLVEAASVKATAAAQLAEIDRKLQALPGEIEALRQRGAEEIAAEEQRIAAAAAAERDRLLEQTRREIDLQLRLARRELVEHTANLAVQLAGQRIQQQITPADQERLVDRYLDQVRRPAPGERSESKGPH
jgi:F-type H+-transporting ATPase subunit b